MENVTLKQASNYVLTPEGTVINKKSGKPMTETNGTVTLSVDGKRKRFKVAELIETNQPKKKAKKTTTKKSVRRSAVIKMTKLEKEVLRAVLESDYQDKQDPVGHPVWYLEENDVNMKKGQLSGAISSCVKKGFVEVVQEDKDSTITLTKLGYDIFNASEPKRTKTKRKVGDERTRKDGRVMVWSKTPTGFDWRRKVDHRRKENR